MTRLALLLLLAACSAQEHPAIRSASSGSDTGYASDGDTDALSLVADGIEVIRVDADGTVTVNRDEIDSVATDKWDRGFLAIARRIIELEDRCEE